MRQIRIFLRIWSHLLKKSLMENFIFCEVISLVNSFLANVPILHPLKKPESLWFSGVFKGCKIRTLAKNE